MTRSWIGSSVALGALVCMSVVLPARPELARAQGAGQGQGQGRAGGRGAQPPGQASDGDNKDIADGVKADQAGFVSIFDGKSMTGWNLNATSNHSATSGNKSPGRWDIRDGVITGSQDVPGNGGLFMTDRTYTDFEIAVDMRNDFGMDSGLFLRSDQTGSAYQVVLDYRRGGGLGLSPSLTRRIGSSPRVLTLRRGGSGTLAPSRCPSRSEHGRVSGGMGSGMKSVRASSASRPASRRGSMACSSWTIPTPFRDCLKGTSRSRCTAVSSS
jgi:hypothetical protein